MSIDCNAYNDQLRQVFRVFETVTPIFDTTLVVEHIAFCALHWSADRMTVLKSILEYHPNTYRLESEVAPNMLLRNLIAYGLIPDVVDEIFLPTALPVVDVYHFRQALELLEGIFCAVDDLGEWFDQCLIPFISAKTFGGQYATPRHLTRFIAHLAQVNANDSLADFACGTGGFLVAGIPVRQVSGVEISLNVARLAFTNLILHKQKQHKLQVANAFQVSLDIPRDERFDVVLLNPPFGVRLEPFLIEDTFSRTHFGGDFKGNSETLFAALAYERLKSGGRMAVMVPSGVLFSNNRGETRLRHILLEDGALRAVISLPRDATQPYSALPTHILYAIKPDESTAPGHSVWFYRARYDGFTGGRNRLPDPEHNDLPLIKAAVTTPGTDEQLQVIPLFSENAVTGYRVEGNEAITFRVRPLGSGFFAEVMQQATLSEVVYIEGEEIYRGLPTLQPIPVQWPTEQPITGPFALSDLVNLGGESTYSLLLESGRGEIRKGSLEEARFGASTRDEQDAMGILVGEEGKIISPLITLKVDKPGKDEKTIGYSLTLETQTENHIYLLVFYEHLSGMMLTASSGETRYLLPPVNSSAVVFYDPVTGQFNWSFVLIISPDGKVAFKEGEIFKSDVSRRGAVFDTQGDLIGLSVTHEAILATKGLELQWEKYWPERRATVEMRPAAQILGDIRRYQNRLTTTLDRLLSIAELQPVSVVELPPQWYRSDPPPGLLRGIQEAIWDHVQTHIEMFGEYQTPTPFQADDIHTALGDDVSVMDVQRTLELFERMGLIVAVTYEGGLYYRLLTERDVVGEKV